MQKSLKETLNEIDKEVAMELDNDSQRLKFTEAGCKSQAEYMRVQEMEGRQR
jgi:hypothetical protein